MKRLLAILLALSFAGSAQARGLVVTSAPFSANAVTGISRISEVGQGMLNTLGANYDVMNVCDFPVGSTDAMRRGAVYRNGISSTGDSTLYDPIIIFGSDMSVMTNVVTASAALAVGGFADIRTATANGFQWLKPGMALTGNAITGSAIIVGVDSIYQKLRVRGTVTYNASFTLRWRVPLCLDSLTLTPNYPRVTILHVAQYMGTTASLTTSSDRCSTGVGATATYAPVQDSSFNVYEVGNPARTWKSRVSVAALSTRDTRGWRPIIGHVSTRQDNAGLANGNYDFPAGSLAYSDNPDSVALWMVMNRDAAGVRIGGDAAPIIYAMPAGVTLTNAINPGIMLTAFALADSFSGGGLFSNSEKLPRKFSIHIDDGWKRGDSNGGGGYGGIAWSDTTVFIATIDSLAALAVPFVVGVELDSLDSVLLSAGVTGNGRYYDQRWWARAPLAHYTPHCHAGLFQGTNRSQNNATKYLRPLDLFGLSRTRYAFGSPDSLLAGLGIDYVNDVADSGAYYWLGKRAKSLSDSAFGSSKVDGLVMPPGDDWTVSSIKHTRARQHGLGVDSVLAATLAMGMTGIRANSGNNIVGNDDSTVTNNYGYYPNWKRIYLPHSASGSGEHPTGMPTWLPANLYGRSCDIVPTNGYPGGVTGLNGSRNSWSQSRSSFGGEKFLLGLLAGHVTLGTDYMATGSGGREVYILTSHCSDFGGNGEERTRPQFYTIKYVTNAIRTANAHARRDLVRIVYPQDVRP